MGVKKTKNIQENGENCGLSYFHSVGKNPLVYRTIGQQLKLSAQANAKREAFVFVEENKRFTYEQLLSEADRLAAGFQCLGLDKGDRVGILMPNVSAWPITMFAAARAGLISVSLNPTYTPQEIQDCLNKVSAKALVASEKFGSKIYYDQLLEILPELSSCNSKKVQNHLEAKVIDNKGKLVPFGTPGELCIRGYSTMMGYWGDEQQTRKILGSDGWLKTGDYFILEPNGYGKIIGRISDIITKGTEKIFPKEIESLLGTFPAIEEVYVVGVPDKTIGQQLKLSAQANAERVAFVFVEENKRFTYEQLLSEADRLAAGFQCLGLDKGDRVGILMPNVSAWPITMFAAARAGLISVSLNPTYTPQEIQDCLNKVSAKALVASEKFGSKIYYDQLLEILPELSSCNSKKVQSKRLPFLSTIIIDSEKDYPGTFPLSDVMFLPTIQQINSIEDQQDNISPESGCIILFTSGFTGSPKAVLLSHNCMINNALPTKIVEISKSRVCMPLPFCHFYALVTTMGAFCNDATVIVPNYIFDSEKTFNAIYKEKCTIIFGVPNLFMGLMYTQKKLKFDFSNLIGITAGANCSPEAFYKIKKELGLKKLKIAMGMTESGISFASLPDDKEENIIDTVGYLYSHLEAKVIDNYGKLVPFGTPGELCIRGPLTMKGYWGDEEQTRKILGSDGWLKTGDYFILEPNGYGKIIGRISDIITKGSEKIFPKEIESLLGTFPAIEEVYVVGVPDEHWGEELCAFIRLREGHHSLSSEDIYEFCKGKIPSLKIPRYVRLVDDFPKTVSGKIKTIELKKKFKC
ncbi:medium-chain acyl-CoA ligase ACSF2, mitochondrial-like [Lutzomyia longipalpis]|uniref:medium-chain acyl-CoA ligase ACSF2, mitochondrial-like n=1 Tax=Lutzomyia longipalpis TaxID=7200 RepID=UPI0024836815|nr:medium-chain acyl-CoA ligase ACSF2, mitochondrial-like [Lutzomyia longipalpis]